MMLWNGRLCGNRENQPYPVFKWNGVSIQSVQSKGAGHPRNHSNSREGHFSWFEVFSLFRTSCWLDVCALEASWIKECVSMRGHTPPHPRTTCESLVVSATIVGAPSINRCWSQDVSHNATGALPILRLHLCFGDRLEIWARIQQSLSLSGTKGHVPREMARMLRARAHLTPQSESNP